MSIHLNTKVRLPKDPYHFTDASTYEDVTKVIKYLKDNNLIDEYYTKLIGTVVITMYENGISSTLINLNLAYNLLAKLIADGVDVPYEFKHKYREYYDNTVYQKIGP